MLVYKAQHSQKHPALVQVKHMYCRHFIHLPLLLELLRLRLDECDEPDEEEDDEDEEDEDDDDELEEDDEEDLLRLRLRFTFFSRPE